MDWQDISVSYRHNITVAPYSHPAPRAVTPCNHPLQSPLNKVLMREMQELLPDIKLWSIHTSVGTMEKGRILPEQVAFTNR